MSTASSLLRGGSASPRAVASKPAYGSQGEPLPSWFYTAAAIAAVLLAWSAVTGLGWVDPVYLPGPMSIIREFTALLRDGYKGSSLAVHIGISLYRTLLGFVLGVALGIPVGLLTGYNRVVSATVSPFMAFIRPIPPIAFIPMVVLYFGLSEAGKVVLIFFTAFNYAQLNAHAGAANIPLSYLRAAQSMGLGRRQIFLRVVAPAAIPQIFAGLKVAMALSWAVVVAAELVGAQKGLGFMISDAAQFFQIPVVFIGIGLIGLIGLLLNMLLNRLENWLVHWRGR